MTEEERIHLLAGPLDYAPYGKDVTAWRWFLNGHPVVVEITNTACEMVGDMRDSDPDNRLALAVRTQGRSEIERMLDWDVPNPAVFLTTEAFYEPPD